MRINCEFCGELIEEEPVRWGSLYFCSPECYQEYLEHDFDEEDEDEDRASERK